MAKPNPPSKKAGTSVTKLPNSILKLVIGSVIGGLLVAAMALPLIGPAAITARDSIQSFEDLPRDFRDPILPVRTKIYAADGTKIATVFEENRKEVPIDDVAPVMRRAVVAIEDSRFYEHAGFDPRGFLRAAATNVSSGQVAQGGSTLTMQYVKNVLFNVARNKEEQAAARADTITRKLREIRYAMALEKRLTKDEILAGYLNISYYGARAYGVEAASQRYFSKKASKLNLVEAATLAGIVQQPSRFDPLQHPRASQARRDVVLNRMAELGDISVEDARRAKAKDVETYLKPSVPSNGCTTSLAPYFCDYAVRQAKGLQTLGQTPEQRELAWQRGGFKVFTTMDLQAQTAATAAVNAEVPEKDPSLKALVAAMVQPGTGDIAALTQNTSWGTANEPGTSAFNLAVTAEDGGGQGAAAGSTFKIFTLLAALEQGISPYTVINSPPRKEFLGFVGCDGSPLSGPSSGGLEPYPVKNSTRSGNFNMFQGTAYSVNTFFVELEKRAGVCETVDVARRLGITHATGEALGEVLPSGASAEVASFTLGSTEVTPLMMANAYATVSAHGIYCQPRVIARIVDRNGQALPVPAPKCKQVISRNVADAAAAILSRVVDGYIQGRTGAAMSLGRDTTGKTGTIDNNAAVWFAGSTPDLAASVMLYDPRSPYRYPLTNLTINGRYYREVFGSSIPGPTWKRAMTGALAGRTPVPMQLSNEWNLRPARGSSTSVPNWPTPPPSSPVTSTPAPQASPIPMTSTPSPASVAPSTPPPSP